MLKRLKTKLNTNKPFAIFANGDTSKGDVIKAYFVSKDSNNGVTLVDENGNIINDLNTKENVKSNLITGIDVSDYINQISDNGLMVSPTVTTIGTFVNDGTDIKFPKNDAKTGFLSQMNFDQIKDALSAVGVEIRYKGYNPTSSSFDNWVTDLTLIKNYNSSKPEIKIGFKVNQDWKVEMFNSNDKLDENYEFGIKLNLPKQINIKEEYLNDAKQILNFSGDTKQIIFNESGPEELIIKILDGNDADSGGNTGITSAKLKILFNVGGFGWFEHKVLKTNLASNWKDLKSRDIKYKFELDPSQTNDFVLAEHDKTYELFADDSRDNPLKIYINDKYGVNDQGIFDSLKNTKVRGSNKALILEFINNISVDKNTGILSAANPERGSGLKIEFTFKSNIDANGSSGSDIENEWVSRVPDSFKTQYTETGLWLRIITTDNKYKYEFEKQKFKLDLSNIPLEINVKPEWLNQQFSTTKILLNNKNALKQAFIEYENLVWQTAKQNGLADVDKNKILIKYDFNNQSNLTLEELINQITNFSPITKNFTNLGILQLWNGISGEKINAKFSKAEANGNYELNFNGSNNNFEINFLNVLTEIDFSDVLTWLKSKEIEIEEGANNTINNLKIPDINLANNPYFNNRTWDEVENGLEQFGIFFRYSNNLENQGENWGPKSSVNKYNPKSPSFKIRFNTDGSKSKNIKFKLSNQSELDGSTAVNSAAEIIKIKAKLLVEIPNSKLDEFKLAAELTGNTKFLEINKAQSADAKLINDILEHNIKIDSRYEQLRGKLKLQYIMQEQKPNEQSDWKELIEFKKSLEEANDDKTNNRIWYRINLEDQVNFSLDFNFQDPMILSDYQSANDSNLKIQYYVNTSDWEEKASKIVVSGTNDHLQWNFNDIFNKNIVETNDNKVYLKTAAGQGLQIYFTLNNSATYDSPDLSDDKIEINSKWVSIRPDALSASTKILKIKLVANKGYVYGAKKENKASAHDVELNFQSVIYVKNEWFNKPIVTTDTEISSLQKRLHFDPWETKIYDEIKNLNAVNDDIARKINIKYIFNGDKSNQYDAQGLLDHLLSLRNDFGNADLGIIKLWNNTDQKGVKIDAIFESSDKKYILKVDQNSSTPQTEEQLKSQINTDQIYRSISMIEYLTFLSSEQNKTNVDHDPNSSNIASISGFTPPTMSGNKGDKFLSGWSYDEISKRLKDLGIDILFSKNPDDNIWLEKDKIKEYDLQKNALFMAFQINSQNIKIQLTSTENIGAGQNNKANPTKLPLNVKKYILINQNAQFWQKIKQEFSFSGNTKKINFNKNKIDEFLFTKRQKSPLWKITIK